jgi:hypothetical protein
MGTSLRPKGERLMNLVFALANGHYRRIAFFIVGLALTLCSQATFSQSLRSKEEISRIVALEDITVQDGKVSGEVHNNSANTLRDVQLFIRYTWLWDNEFHPGTDDPGASHIYTLPKEIPPGGRVSFTFSPSPPLVKAAGGHFVTSVFITGFTEVIPQTK